MSWTENGTGPAYAENGSSGSSSGGTHGSGTLAARPASPSAGDTYAVTSGTGAGDAYTCLVAGSWTLTTAARRMVLSSLLHQWKLDEGAGTSFADTGSSPNALTLTGSADVAQPGIVGKCITFSGSGTVYARTAASPSTPAAGAWSITLSALWTSVSGVQYLLSKLSAFGAWTAPYAGVAIYLDTGTLGVGTSPGGTWDGGHSASFTPALRRWYRIAVTYDGTSIRVYVDGYLTATIGAVGDTTWGTGEWVLGSNAPAGGFDMVGALDEVSVYDAVLTPAQAAEDYLRSANLWAP